MATTAFALSMRSAHAAMDAGELTFVWAVLCQAEDLARLARPTDLVGSNRLRREVDELVAAHERLWHLRHAGPGPLRPRIQQVRLAGPPPP